MANEEGLCALESIGAELSIAFAFAFPAAADGEVEVCPRPKTLKCGDATKPVDGDEHGGVEERVFNFVLCFDDGSLAQASASVDWRRALGHVRLLRRRQWRSRSLREIEDGVEVATQRSPWMMTKTAVSRMAARARKRCVGACDIQFESIRRQIMFL